MADNSIDLNDLPEISGQQSNIDESQLPDLNPVIKTPEQKAGILSNAPTDTTETQIAKGAATATLKGAADYPGMLGNLSQMRDTLLNHAYSYISGTNPEENQKKLSELRAAHPIANAILDPTSMMPTGQSIYDRLNKFTGNSIGEYEPASGYGRAAMMGTEAAVGGLGFGELSAANTAKNFASGAAGQAATDASGNPLVGLAVGALTPYGAGKAYDAVSPKIETALKPVTDFTRPFYKSNQSAMADEMLRQAASDPNAVVAAGTTKPNQVIAGSQPSLAEQSQDIGLAKAEQAARTANIDYAKKQEARAGAQNQARTNFVENVVSPNTDIMAPVDFLNSESAKIDAAHQSAINHLTGVADDLNSEIPAPPVPEASGMQLRNAIEAASDAAKTAHSQLYGAVDPQNKMRVVSSGIQDAANSIANEPFQEVRSPSPISDPVVKMAASMGAVEPFNKLAAFDQTVTEAMMNARRDGDGAAIRHLTILKSSVMDAMNNAVENQHEFEQAGVQSGAVSPADTIESRVRNLAESSGVNDPERNTGANGGQGAVRVAAGETPNNPEGDLGGSQTAGGVRGPSSVEGVQNPQPEAPTSADLLKFSPKNKEEAVQMANQVFGEKPNSENAAPVAPAQNEFLPNASPEEINKLKQAKAKYAEYAQTYKSEPVASALQTTGLKGQYKNSASSLQNKAFTPSTSGYETAKAFLKAGQNSPDAISAMKDFAVSNLRSMMKSESLTPDALQKWKTKYSNALRAIDEVSPNFSSSFDNAAKATETLSQAHIAHEAAIKNYQIGAAGKLIGATTPQEVQAVIGSLMNTSNGPTQISALLKKLSVDPDAVEGLKRAGLEHIINHITNAGERGGSPIISGPKLGDLLKKRPDSLRALLGDEGFQNLSDLHADIQRTNNILSVGNARVGPGTSTDLYAKMHAISEQGHGMSIPSLMALSALEAAGKGGFAHAILMGGSAAALAGVKAVVSKARASGLKSINDMYLKGLEDPELGRAMIQRAIDKKGNINQPAIDRVSNLISRSSVLSQASPSNKEERPQRAAGGKVNTDHQYLVDRLVKMSDLAKRQQNEVTKPLLGAPDEAVVKALKLTQQGI